MAFRLDILVGRRELGSHEVKSGDELSIGRESTNDIVVPDRSVSRQHCRVRGVAGGVEFVDQNSANGLYHDGRIVHQVVVGDGGTLNLGMAQIKVKRVIVNHTGMIPVAGLVETLNADFPSSATGDPFLDSDPSSVSSSGPVFAGGWADTGTGSSSGIASQRPEYKAIEKERLALLVETSKSLGQSNDLEQLLSRIMDHLFAMLPVKRAVVALTEDGETFSARITRPSTETEEMSFIASKSILREVWSTQQGQIIEDAMIDQKLRSNMSIVAGNIRAAVCTPIVANNKCHGAIYADYPGHARLYTKADLDFLTAFASIAAVALENTRMMQQLREDARLHRDLKIAADIQQGFLPSPERNISFEGIEFDWTYWPSRDVGGDFFDIMETDDGLVAVVIGDVSGKSVPAALYMMQTVSFLRATLRSVSDPGQVLTRVNQLLGMGGRSERVLFATTFVMVVDRVAHTIRWSNAGHNPSLVREPEKGEYVRLEAAGIPLGVLEDSTYETSSVAVCPGTFVTLYTDGLVEARDRDGVEFGLDRVIELVESYQGKPVIASTQAMITAIQGHTRGSPYRRDDVAILNMRIL